MILRSIVMLLKCHDYMQLLGINPGQFQSTLPDKLNSMHLMGFLAYIVCNCLPAIWLRAKHCKGTCVTNCVCVRSTMCMIPTSAWPLPLSAWHMEACMLSIPSLSGNAQYCTDCSMLMHHMLCMLSSEFNASIGSHNPETPWCWWTGRASNGLASGRHLRPFHTCRMQSQSDTCRHQVCSMYSLVFKYCASLQARHRAARGKTLAWTGEHHICNQRWVTATGPQ